ncbi:T9SS type B sorting domain-containing protein [uncultured Flavobacterium sp.]|uniref:T9SS type B sorting domain-containing protein n=1 Tax=uncultured Flavobacterium sp. TaxID=165435 RepID=UPI0030EE8BDA
MKKPTISKTALVVLMTLLHFSSYAQNLKPFTIRYNKEMKGSMLVIGNSTLGINNVPFNGGSNNEVISMKYIDIDADDTTFSSSSATLAIPATTTCFTIAYAGLYWGALIKTADSRTSIKNVKLKLPGSSVYTDIVGTAIYDNPGTPIAPDSNKPYACYADVTSLVSGLGNAKGVYTVANVSSSIGDNGSTGLSAGWTLVVVYEDPTTTTKSITTFDGFSAIFDGSSLDIPVSGFITPPSPAAVNIQFGFATLNGDRVSKTIVEVGNGGSNGDRIPATAERPNQNFFNSSITDPNGYLAGRVPDSKNTLGYDTGTVDHLNAAKVGNNATKAVVSLQIPKGQANTLFSFFNSFLINVVAPDISLTKIVEDASGNDIGNTTINLGQDLYYKIDFKNIGNDNVTNFTLEDVLPKNVIFNYPADITSLPVGVTHTYNAATRRLTFTIPDALVKIGDPLHTIRLHVKVVSDYNLFSDACSNEVKNQAFANYRGVVNTTPVVGEGSFASTVCNFGAPSSTNFLANIDGYTFTRNQVLCGSSVVLNASNGYDTYSWSTSPTGSPVIGTNQTYTATSTGTYYVSSVSNGSCKSIKEEITVIPYGNTITNPVIPYAESPYKGEVVTCPNNGKKLPNIFLCGANASRLIQTNITDASSIEWQKLDEASCPSTAIANCANESFANTCWKTVATGPNYSADTAGQFRVVLKYAGGCQSIFYFNVYKNILNPTVTTNDIICTTNGNITVGGVPSGYEYSLDKVNYQLSTIFTIATAGTYTVYIRQVGVTTNPCIFEVQNILIRKRNFTVSEITTQPLCNGDLGSIRLVANDARAQYFFSISKSGVLVNSVGPILANENTFSNLSAGTYTYEVRTEDGCIETGSIDIINPDKLTATAALTKALTCANGEITIYPVGGTPPYKYFVNSTTVFQTVPQIVVSKPLPPGGVYNITVVDANNCSTTTSITVAEVPKPDYTVSKTDVLCYGSNSGEIKFNVSNANGYSLRYSINNGTSYSTNATFSNLAPGTYTPVLEYTLSEQVCTEVGTPITITGPAAALTASAEVSELAGCGPNGEGKIRVSNPQGGTPFPAPNPYLYSFDSQGSWTNLNEAYKMPGNYTVYIKDANGCVFPMAITVDPQPVPPTINTNTIINCDGTATVTVNNNGASNFNYEYLIDNVLNTNTPSNVFVNVPSGPHTITVNYTLIVSSSVISCVTTKEFPITIDSGKAFTASVTGFSNLKCLGSNDGTITIAAQNFDATTGFQYSTNNGANWFTTTTSPVTVSGLAANTYSVLVRPNSSSAAVCTKTFSVPITAPTAVTASATIILQATCSTGATIRAVGGGGTPAYQYELRQANGTTVVTAFNNNPDFTNVPAGSYTVFVQDANACSNATGVPITVNAPPTLTATLNASTDYCYTVANPATLVVNVSGGVGPFTYKLDSNASISSALTTFSFANVTPGTHTIEVTDSNNCTSTIPNIVIAPAVAFNVSLLQDLTCLVNASIGNPIITGGYGPTHTYTVSFNSGTPTAVASFPYTATVAGTYVFTVSDSKGCPATSNTITVTPKTTPTHTTVKTDSTCNGLNNGTITVTASGGFTTTYTYAIKGSSATTYTTQTTNQFTGLAAGTYDIKVIDSKGCESTPSQVTIINPTPIAANATATAFKCSTTNANQSATITVAPTGGTGTYTYSYNNGASYGSSSTLTVNDNGLPQTFDIIVKDANGCLSPVQTITLAPLNKPTDLTFSNAAVTCTATTTTVSVTATNGVGALRFEITGTTSATASTNFGPITTTGSAQAASFPNLLPGNYTFRVTDANGCYYSESYTIVPVTPIVATATKLTDVDCRGNTTGSIRYGVSGFASGYSYTVNGGSPVAGTASTFTLPNLGAITYNVVFTDNVTGCTASTSVTINQPAAALSASYTTINANCNVPTSSVTVTVAGGTPSFRYSFVTSSTTPGTYGTSNTANLNPATPTWYAHIIDANNCTFVLPITIAKDPLPTVTASATGQCLGSGSYTITASGLGGVGTLSYSINGGASYQAGNTFVVTTAGNYTITVKDGNGCTNTSNVITVNPQLTLTAVLNKDITCSAPDPAQITLTPTGGTAAYTYEYKEAAGVYTTMASNVFNTSTPGSYTFRVTDNILCQAVTTTPIVLTTPIDPDITGVTQTAFINCNGDDTAAISIAIDNTKGQSPFVFNVTRTTPTVFNYGTQTSGLSAGDYVVTVTDAKGCTDFETITISEPPPMVIDFRVIDIQCVSGSGISKGSIIIDKITDGVSTVGGSGGTLPYTYYVTGINGYNQSEMNPGNISTTFDVVDFGFYQIRVVDAKGCTVIESDVKVASDPDDLDIVINTTANCALGGTADVAVLGALTSSGPFHFNIYNGPGQVFIADGTDGWQGETPPGSKGTTFTGLLPGVTYTFIVYDSATLCYYYETAVTPIPSNSSLVVGNLVPKNITCTGSADGNVSFDVTNSSGVAVDYTYEIFEAFTNISQYLSGPFTVPGSSTVNIPSIPITLGVGSYYVYVRETSGPNTGCGNASANFNIQESPVLLVVDATLVKNSNCTELGIISAAASNGTGPYTYQVTTSATPPLASDASWVSGNTFTRPGSLTGIIYYVYAKDSYNCIQSTTETVFADENPTISTPAPICYDGNPFTITISGTVDPDIVGAPTYSVNGSAFQSSSSFTFNASGTYNLEIKDGNGCTANVDYIVYPQLQLTPTLTKVLDCTGTPNATITLNTIGGNTTPASNYTYEVNFNSGGFVAATTPYSASAPGSYEFRVTDANNPTLCQTTATIVLDPIPATIIATPVVTNVICNGESNGTITVTVTSGEGPYTYALSGTTTNATGDASGVYTGLPVGNYVVTVRNGRGCLQASTPITITEPVILTATDTFTVNTTCSPTTIITVTAAGGNGGYLYNFNGLGYTTANIYTVNNLTTATTVSYTVKDAKGCVTVSKSVTTPALNPPTDMDITGTPIYCVQQGLGDVTSTVTINTVTNGVVPFTYQMLMPTSINNSTNNVFTGLTAGDYLFQVTDANGCTYQELYTVAPRVDIAVAVTTITDETCFNTDNGTATFTVANSAGYTATLTVGTGTPVIAGTPVSLTALAPGNYTLQVVDTTTGCLADVPFVIGGVAQVLDFTSTATNTNCSTDMATITVVASGGTVNYKYVAVIAGSTVPAASAYGSSNTLVVDTNGGANMAWDVYVMDANGCFITKPQNIVLDASPVITSVVATPCPSPTGTYTITVTATGFSTALQYSAGGGNFQTGNVITVNAPGTYTISVKDANGCATTAAPVTILDPLILTPTVTTSPSCADGDGVIAVATTGGSGNYEYRIGSGVYPMATPFTGIASGTHTIYVRDITTGCEVTTTVTLQPATLITGFSLNTTAVTCNGGTDGTITATLATLAPGVNDNPVYTYTLNGTIVGGLAVSRPSQNSQLFSGLSAGTYTVVVTSGRACTATQTIDVLEPAVLVVPAPTVVQFGCTTGNVGNNATITVTGVTGGTTPYLNYEFIKIGTPNTQVQFSASNVYTEGNLLGGSYIVNVYDSKGCFGTTTGPITIAPYVALVKVNVTINQAITCSNLEDITVTATTVGGTATNLEYTLVDANTTGTLYPSQTNTTGIFTNLPVADYLITVRNLDTNCEIKGVHYVNEPNTFDVTIDAVVDVTCFGGTTGSANVTFVDRYITTTPPNGDDAGAFTYTLVDAAGTPLPGGTSPDNGPIPISGLAAGTYTITATLSQSPDCAVTKNFTITGPTATLALMETHTEITCAGADGSISVSASGGWPGGYEFQLELGGNPIVLWSAGTDFTGLTAGSYTVNVKDSKGCIVPVNVNLLDPTPIAVTASPDVSLLSCYGDTSASITVNTVTGGSGDYLYTLQTLDATGNVVNSNGPQQASVFNNLGAGTYNVMVTDTWSCSNVSSPIVITEPAKVIVSLVKNSSQTCLTEATLTLSATGGTGPYTYSADGSFTPSGLPEMSGSFTAATPATFSVPVGTYHYYVRDAKGCTSYISNDIKIDPLETLVINLDKTNAVINCAGDNTGVIVATAQGGLGNYSYTLLDGLGAIIQEPQPSGNFTGLFAGKYQVKVDSGDCTTLSSVISITQPASPLIAPYVTIDVTCNGAKNGILQINASGGSGSIKYAISPYLNQFVDTNIFDKLAPGNYDIIVQDILGCYVKINFDITEPAPIVASTVAGSILPEICAGDKDGAFMIEVDGGVLPYSVSLDDPNGTYTVGTATQTEFDFTDLSGGNHFVFIRDANGCTTDWLVALPESINMTPIAVVQYDCVNNAAVNTVTISIDDSITDPADVDYALDGGDFKSSAIFTNLAPGTHFVTARHSNGCEQQTIIFNIVQVDPLTLVLNDGGLNEIVAVAAGGGGGYTYMLNGESYGSTSNFIIYKSGEYTVTVADVNGCVASVTKYMEYIDVCIPNYFTPNGDGVNDGWAPGCTENYKNLLFSIFDRYGRKVGDYRTGQYWDGKYNGAELPSGDYWYVLRLNDMKDAREFVGHFTLYR